MAFENKKYYLCRRFRIAYLLKVFLRDVVIRRRCVVIYYLKPGPASALMENNAWVKSVFSSCLKVQRLPYNIAEISAALNYSLLKEVHGKVLPDIMDRIDGEMLPAGKNLFRSLPGRLASVEKDIGLYMKREIALDITDDLLLVELAACLPRQKSNDLYGIKPVVLIDRKNYWSKFVFEYADKKDVAFLRVRRITLRRNKAVQFGVYFIQMVAECAMSLFCGEKKHAVPVESRIGIPYYVHKNFSDFFRQRNYYLFWYPDSGIDPERVVIYSDGAMDIPPGEAARINEEGFAVRECCNTFRRRTHPSIARHRCSVRAAGLFIGYVAQLLKLAAHVRGRLTFEQWKILAVLFTKLPFWEDFFTTNNIMIKFRFHPHFSYRDIAAKLSGATTISYQYTNHARDKSAMWQHDVSDVYFVWGEAYQRPFLNQHSNIGTIVQCGYVFDHAFNTVAEQAAAVRNEFAGKGVSFVVTVLNEAMTGAFKENVLSLFHEVLRFVLNNPDAGLLVKPKFNNIRAVLEASEKTAELFSRLEGEGRVKILDQARYPVEAGKASDVAIGVYADSTAGLESALAGVPTIVYGCPMGEQDTNPYGAAYKNKMIFDDLKTMIGAIERFKREGARPGGFADWTGILEKRDPFRDGQAGRRVGFYMKMLLDGLGAGLNKDEGISRANTAYRQRYGRDKVTDVMQEELKIDPTTEDGGAGLKTEAALRS